ncbi:MAG: RHS repeat-associated core domain-containing protein [Acidobacteria bacterium]|nr:RHS repeat-associated core domain-containing protein [Acidobacteriota bacterium]
MGMIDCNSCHSTQRPAFDSPFPGKERDAETGLDYFGARYYSGAQGRFVSPDAPFADQNPENPQSWNLYAYTRNNPLMYVDQVGREIILAVGIRNHEEVSATVQAILADPNTRSELADYAGMDNPDLIIQSGDLSSLDRQILNSDGTTTTIKAGGSLVPDIKTTTFGNEAPVTTLVGATMTIDNRTSGNELSTVMTHEIKHAGDARRDPAGFLNEIRRESGKEHDLRTHEKRAIEFSIEHSQEIRRSARQFRQQQRRIEEFLRRSRQ